MQLDLNLLTAFDALLEEGSVMGAAHRLHLSTPAMSRTLGRIRAATGDQIMVRTGRTMTPTPYALGVREQVHLLVQQAHAVLSPQRALDLTSLERTFTLQCHDALTSAIAPTLVDGVRRAAPGVCLRFVAEPALDTNDLRRGRVDLELGATQPVLPEIRWVVLGAGRIVVVARADSAAASGDLTVASYAAGDHVIVSRRGKLHDRVDDLLAERGLRRRVVAAVPTTIAALQIVRFTNMVATVAEAAGQNLIGPLGLRTAALPLDVPATSVVCAWHQRYETDPAHEWLRRQVARAVTTALQPL